MNQTNLSEIKQHLQIDIDYIGDDEYLMSLIKVAEEIVSQHINRSLSEYVELPAPIKQAILLLIGNYYSNREPITVGVQSYKLPLSYEYLLSPYIKYSSL